MSSMSRSVAITSVGNFIPPLVGIVTAPILATALGVTGRGELAAATAPFLLATNVATLGLPDAVTYFVAKGRRDSKRIIAWSLIAIAVLGLISTGVILLLAPALAGGDAGIAELIGLASLAVAPVLAVGAIRGVAVGYGAWKVVAGEKLIGSGARLIAVVWLASTGNLDLLTGTVVMVGSTFVGVLAYALLPFAARFQTGLDATPTRLSELLSFGSRVWLGSLTGILLSRLDQTLILPLAGAYELGLYAVAVTISEMTLVFNASVATVIFATEARSRDSERLAAATRISTAITILGCVGVGVASIWALPFFFGTDFAPAQVSLWILLAAVVIGNPGSVAGAGLNARGRPGLRSASLLIALVVNVIAVMVFVPIFGSEGAAWATFAGNLVAGGLNLIWLRAFFGLKISDFLGLRRSDVEFVRARLRRK